MKLEQLISKKKLKDHGAMEVIIAQILIWISQEHQ